VGTIFIDQYRGYMFITWIFIIKCFYIPTYAHISSCKSALNYFDMFVVNKPSVGSLQDVFAKVMK
jgi:hypothetical protein